MALMVVLVFSINCVILIVMHSLINVPIYINWELGIIILIHNLLVLEVSCIILDYHTKL